MRRKQSKVSVQEAWMGAGLRPPEKALCVLTADLHKMVACHDKANHGPYGPCSANRARCCGRHRARFWVCDSCALRTRRKLGMAPGGPLHNRIRGPVASLSPRPTFPGSNVPLAATRPNPPWRGFFTRVCDDCELKIQSLRCTYIRTLLPTPENVDQWTSGSPQYDNSCTCLNTLGVGQDTETRCYSHSRQIADALIAKKDENDIWLRNTMINGQGRLVRASPARLRERRMPHAGGALTSATTWRACRCGRDCLNRPTAGAGMQEVWVCMACEGYRSEIDPRFGRHQLIDINDLEGNVRIRHAKNGPALGRKRSDDL